MAKRSQQQTGAGVYEEELDAGAVGEDGDAAWESTPDASEATAESDYFEVAESTETDDPDDHVGVSSADAGETLTEMEEAEEAAFEGGDEASALADDGELEAVSGFDPAVVDETREGLAAGVSENQLLDAWYADLGDPAMGALLQTPAGRESFQEVVIGADDRVRIRNTRPFPWRAICSLRITARDGSRWIGTGWMVGRRTVITAGHVVFIHSRGGWVRSIEVIPGRNGAQRPFGAATATSFRSVKGWTNSRKRSHDYGAILLPRNAPLGNRVGWFGYANYSFLTLLGMKVNLSGYPGDKPAGTQWWHARRLKWITSRTLVYNIDTAGGQSGSPVWRKKGGQRYAVGIHTNGHSSGNSATRITAPVFKNIKQWKAQGM